MGEVVYNAGGLVGGCGAFACWWMQCVWSEVLMVGKDGPGIFSAALPICCRVLPSKVVLFPFQTARQNAVRTEGGRLPTSPFIWVGKWLLGLFCDSQVALRVWLRFVSDVDTKL